MAISETTQLNDAQPNRKYRMFCELRSSFQTYWTSYADVREFTHIIMSKWLWCTALLMLLLTLSEASWSTFWQRVDHFDALNQDTFLQVGHNM